MACVQACFILDDVFLKKLKEGKMQQSDPMFFNMYIVHSS